MGLAVSATFGQPNRTKLTELSQFCLLYVLVDFEMAIASV